jgi:hypothetical protein
MQNGLQPEIATPTFPLILSLSPLEAYDLDRFTVRGCVRTGPDDKFVEDSITSREKRW